jgi:hypothetical protein
MMQHVLENDVPIIVDDEEEVLTEDCKNSFIKYLKLVFEDLCAKDNGLTRSSFGLYTFLKVNSTFII